MKILIYRFIVTLLLILVISLSSSLAQSQLKLGNKEQVNGKSNKPDKWFAMDKLLHFTASAGITGLSYHCYHCQFNNPEKNSIYFSVTFAGASGIGKELFDLKYRKTGWSWKDIVVDAAGIAAGYFLFIKLKK